MDAVLQDIETVHSNVKVILNQLGLPEAAPLQISRFISAHSPGAAQATSNTNNQTQLQPGGQPSGSAVGPSCDNSPRLSPEDDGDLSAVPIRSMYHLTKLSALRSPAASDDSATKTQPSDGGHMLHRASGASQPDFIARGVVTHTDAERLFRLYMDRLDNYFYGVVGSRYTDLATMRQGSPILTAAVITVAAMHDPRSNSLYPICTAELDRLVTAAILERNINRDHLRALCVASYWLNDTSWVLSGVATRRATEFNVMGYYQRLGVEGTQSEDAADFIRVWYLIFICDQHLSTLYGRPCSGRQDAAITGWQAFTRRPSSTAGDQRLASQVALLMIVQEVRELFSSGNVPVAGSMSSSVILTQIKGFDRQLDDWINHWPAHFPEYQEGFGAFPRKGIQFHGSFAKLYLYSQAFKGVGNSHLPPQLSECAFKAVSVAMKIIEMIILDEDVKAGLVGLPSYIQSMTGFACMFLARLVSLHGDMFVQRDHVISLIMRLKQVYEATPVGKWHLAYLMPKGLERILAMLQQRQASFASAGDQTGNAARPADSHAPSQHQVISSESRIQDTNVSTFVHMDETMANLDPYFLMDSGINLASSQHFHDTFGFFNPNFT